MVRSYNAHRIAVLTALVAGAAFICASCNKQEQPSGVMPDGSEARLTLRYPAPSGMVQTRASDLEQTEGEIKVNTLDILVFRADESGRLDARHRATEEELSSRSASVSCPVGDKDIFLVANVPESFAFEGVTESYLKSYLCRLSDNSRSSFVMIGTPGRVVSLVSGTEGNDVTVELRRLAARVSVRSIKAEFTSPAQRALPFRVKRIMLGYVNGTAPLCFGDVFDPFGAREDGTDASRKEGYYYWPAPETDGGFVNPAVLDAEGKLVASGSDADRDLTVWPMEHLDEDGDVVEDGWLYPVKGRVTGEWSGRALLYAYPNASRRSAKYNDRTTKLIIETEFDGVTYWYPFSIPDMQPNTAYTFSSITLLRLGNLDPDQPLDTDQVDVHVEVLDWENGTVSGSYNGRGGYMEM